MRVLIFLHYRAGSSFFQHLTGHTPKFLRADCGLDPELDAPDYYFMTTKPNQRILAKHTDCGSITNIANTNRLIQHLCILSHIGNWWGDLPSNQIPDPLESPSPMKWGLSELRPFFYEGWKIANVLRDGRNLIESLRNKKGGVEEEFNKSDPQDYFVGLCKAFRNKARIALQCQQLLGKDIYRIFKFEDMMDQPLSFMNDIYRFSFNLDADADMIEEKLKQIRKKNTHSSFTNQTSLQQMKSRHEEWTDEERQIYREIAGREHQELGYKLED